MQSYIGSDCGIIVYFLPNNEMTECQLTRGRPSRDLAADTAKVVRLLVLLSCVFVVNLV